MHPVPDLSAEGLTLQMGIPGAWHDRLHHFQIDSTPASGDELQTEYFVPRAHAVPALQAVEGLRDRFRVNAYGFRRSARSRPTGCG